MAPVLRQILSQVHPRSHREQQVTACQLISSIRSIILSTMAITPTAAILMLFAAGLAFAADPFVGTWKPNPGKWKDSAGAPEGRKSQVLKLEALTNHYHQTQYTLNGRPVIQPDGKTLATADFFLAGKEYQIGAMTIVGQRIDERHFKETAKGKKGTSVIDYVVSADGKNLTVTRKGTGTNTGRPLDEVHVYDKQ